MAEVAQQVAAEQPWYAAFPQAESEPKAITRSEVLDLLKQGNNGRLSVLVDLRRTDYEVSRPIKPLLRPPI